MKTVLPEIIEIEQYDLSGQFMQSFSSKKECAEKLEISIASINRCLSGKQHQIKQSYLVSQITNRYAGRLNYMFMPVSFYDLKEEAEKAQNALDILNYEKSRQAQTS